MVVSNKNLYLFQSHRRICYYFPKHVPAFLIAVMFDYIIKCYLPCTICVYTCYAIRGLIFIAKILKNF